MTNARRVCLFFLLHELGHEVITIRYKIPVMVNSHCRGMFNRGDVGETPNYSEAMSECIAQEISQILDAAYQRARRGHLMIRQQFEEDKA